MKQSKFWIWFIPLFVIASIGIYFMLIRNNNVKPNNNENNNNQKDAISIKNGYTQNNDIYYVVDISDNNVYKYIDENNLKELLDKKLNLNN